MRESLHYEEDSSYTRRAFVGGALAGGLALALPDLSTAATTLRRGGRLRTGHVGGGTTETLMPHNLVAYIDAARAQNLYDGLTAFGQGNKLEYRLAESMEANTRGDQWQIKLRKGVTFHNGKELTADDVLYTWRYMLNPKNTDYLGPTLTGVLDAKRSKKIDSHTVLAQLVDPVGYLPESLALPWQCGIFPDGTTTNQLNRRPNGTGPFKFVSWTPGQRSLFERNENYWVTGKPYVDELEMISIPDNPLGSTRSSAARSTRWNRRPSRRSRRRRATRSLKLVAHAGDGLGRVLHAPEPGAVHGQARGRGVQARDRSPEDRGDLPTSATRPSATTSMARASRPTHRRPSSTCTTPRRRRRCSSRPAMPTGSTSSCSPRRSAPACRSRLRRTHSRPRRRASTSISAMCRRTPTSTATSTTSRSPFYQTYWNSGSFEAITRLAALKTAGTNETAWNRPAFDAGFRRASAVLDPAKRRKAMAPLQELMSEEGGYIIWSFIDSADLTANKVNGLVAHPNAPLGNYDFRSVWLSG